MSTRSSIWSASCRTAKELKDHRCHIVTCFEAKPPRASIKKIFQRRAKQIHYHNIVIILIAEIMHFTKSMAVCDLTVHFVLMSQLRTTSPLSLKFYSNLEI